MDGDETFRRLLDRVRQNDEGAATELVRRYEPEIRTMVRAWLRPWETRLRALFDSTDICQSVLAWFFLNGAPAKYDLDRPDHLRKLFLVMVRNRVFYHVRRHKKDKQVVPPTADAAGREAPPDQALAGRELLAAIGRRFTPEEADLAQRRLEGQTWGEIAAAVGGSADARRMQLARAAERLAHDLAAHE
jgi:DNA-directed RNA polymerase specialized sigma24 family protein